MKHFKEFSSHFTIKFGVVNFLCNEQDGRDSGDDGDHRTPSLRLRTGLTGAVTTFHLVTLDQRRILREHPIQYMFPTTEVSNLRGELNIGTRLERRRGCLEGQGGGEFILRNLHLNKGRRKGCVNFVRPCKTRSTCKSWACDTLLLTFLICRA